MSKDFVVNRNRRPDEPTRLASFASYFKKYMGISSVITAALPIPITALGWIPVPCKEHPCVEDKLFPVYASLFCFLILCLVFYGRHTLGRQWFWYFLEPKPANPVAPWQCKFASRLPVASVILAIVFAVLYPVTLFCDDKYETALKNPHDPFDFKSLFLYALAITSYISFFASATAAFVLMCIKEYVQDELHLTDWEMIHQKDARVDRII